LAICYLNKTKPIKGDVAITFRAYRPRRIGDLDNLQKIVYDALKGSCFDDDKQIVETHNYRYDDKANPRLEIEIKEI
jgi:Holliday junction resolvase RusA-like endonuclease